MEDIVGQFLSHINIPVSRHYCQRLILGHPNYPSLLSVADTFERLGIRYLIRRIGKNDLGSQSFPYLLPLTGPGKILLIKNVNDLKSNQKELALWNGVIVQAEGTSKVSDPDNAKYLAEESLTTKSVIFLLSILGIFLFVTLINFFSIFLFSLMLTSVLGLIVGYLLFGKDVGIKYKTVESFCNGEKSNCDKILNSNDARLYGPIKFSDAVVIYFTFQLFLLSLNPYLIESSASILFVLQVCSLLSIPFVIFSLYHQFFKAKVWCRLCLIIDAVLILQTLTFSQTIGVLNMPLISYVTIFNLLLSFLVISLVVVLIKIQLERTNGFLQSEIESNRIANSINVFSSLLLKERTIDSKPFERELLIGHIDAPIKIVMASNLYCNPCKEKHELISKLIATYSSKVSIAFRFGLSSKDINEGTTANNYVIQYWLENAFGKPDESNQTEELLQHWYEVMDLSEFQKKYPISGSNKDLAVTIEAKHYEWFSSSGISQTPTFYINGYQLPAQYSIKSIIGLIPGLIELISKTSTSSEKKLVLQDA